MLQLLQALQAGVLGACYSSVRGLTELLSRRENAHGEPEGRTINHASADFAETALHKQSTHALPTAGASRL